MRQFRKQIAKCFCRNWSMPVMQIERQVLTRCNRSIENSSNHFTNASKTHTHNGKSIVTAIRQQELRGQLLPLWFNSITPNHPNQLRRAWNSTQILFSLYKEKLPQKSQSYLLPKEKTFSSIEHNNNNNMLKTLNAHYSWLSMWFRCLLQNGWKLIEIINIDRRSLVLMIIFL